jgi:hypothetical protein
MPSPSLSMSPPIGLPPDFAGTLRLEMATWAEPVIADCIAEVYGGYALNASLTSLLAIHHRRLWRALLLDQRATAERIWIDLERDLMRAGLDRDVTDEIDAAVLDELMDIVFARYRSSRETVRAFSRVLLGAAAQTVAVRPLQA